MIKFTVEELSKHDGKEGRKAYVAYKGKVYDVTDSKMWRDGIHMRKHNAGEDLTDALSIAPHTDSVFGKFQVVGELIKSEVTLTADEEQLEKMRKLYSLFHPHPMFVHFPMAFIPFSFLMQALYLATKNVSFFQSGMYSLICAFLGLLVAGSTGVLSWWINYGRGTNNLFKVKFLCTFILVILLCVELYLVFIANQGDGIIYTLLLGFNMLPLAALGYTGGRLTWPHRG